MCLFYKSECVYMCTHTCVCVQLVFFFNASFAFKKALFFMLGDIWQVHTCVYESVCVHARVSVCEREREWRETQRDGY